MNNFLDWIEKERGGIATSTVIVVLALSAGLFLAAVMYWLTHITGGWIILAVLIAPAWVAWMFYCYITRETEE